jgi:hypothetical protein
LRTRPLLRNPAFRVIAVISFSSREWPGLCGTPRPERRGCDCADSITQLQPNGGYVFHSKQASRLKLKKVQVFDVRNSSGVMPSDHRPLMATYDV